jgi:NAD(P)H-dependent flavin oxidoreductase YrpB (nitropropane dioxygenase family)
VWTGSIWLGTEEYLQTMPSSAAMQEALVRATSADTVRTRIYTGKPARLLKTRWTDAWAAPDAPEPLPMPLQNLLVSPAHNRLHEANDPSLVSMPAGQIIGRIDRIRPVAEIIAELLEGYEEALARLEKTR